MDSLLEEDGLRGEMVARDRAGRQETLLTTGQTASGIKESCQWPKIKG
jgi:hypothetical protein